MRSLRELSSVSTLLVALSACVLTAAQAVADDDEAVSNDGEGLVAFAAVGDAGKPFAGMVEETGSDLRAEGAIVEELSDAELTELLALPPVISPAEEEEAAISPAREEKYAQEAILDVDTRIRNYTLDYPARAVTLIAFEGGVCSGFLISRDTVATAGHCVHPGDGGPFYDVGSYEIFPGFDATIAPPPYGSCAATRLFSVRGWISHGDEQFDYGAIKLDCTVGDVTGWFGLRSNAGNDTPAIVTGYPGDKSLEQWQASDKVRVTTSRQLFYATDTAPGGSGGPVWEDLFRGGASRGPFAIAVHTSGIHGTGVHARLNHGTRIDRAAINNFRKWIAASVPTG